MSTKAVSVRAREPGGDGVLELLEQELGEVGQGHVRVSNAVCGVNFIDIYQRSGLYEVPYPAPMGNEAAGAVVAVGDGVTGLSVGDRVAYCTSGTGCYASHKDVPADKAIPLPDGIETRQAGCVMLRGLTAEYLARRVWPVAAGDVVLVTAAAGGVGTILCQWLCRLGARVVGVVGSEDKVDHATANGCDVVLVGYGDLGKRVKKACPSGVAVAYDSVGAATWPHVLDAISPRGCLVSYGNASGPVPPFSPIELSSRGSLFLTRPTLAHYVRDSKSLLRSAAAFFGEVARGLSLPVPVPFPLSQASAAQRVLEQRRCAGVPVLVPEGA